LLIPSIQNMIFTEVTRGVEDTARKNGYMVILCNTDESIEIEKKAISFCVASVDNLEIDKINILNASIKAMQLAVDGLNIVPELLLIDGNSFKKYKNVEHKCIVKGDAKFLAIAAASVLAKTYRDEYIEKLHNEFPYYNWAKNKAYPTKEHLVAIAKHGICKYHRTSYKMNIKF